MVWQAVLKLNNKAVSIIFISLYVLGGAVAIYINSYAGLFNTYTAAWNQGMDIDTNKHWIYDWKNAQFLASKESLIKVKIEKIM